MPSLHPLQMAHRCWTGVLCSLSTADGLKPLWLLLLWGEVRGSAVFSEAVEFPQRNASSFFLRSQERLSWTLSQKFLIAESTHKYRQKSRHTKKQTKENTVIRCTMKYLDLLNMLKTVMH